MFFEITAGRKFENNNIFVQYLLDLPENWKCANPDNLTGITQTGHVSTGEDGLVHFGHNFEVVLEYNLEKLNGNGKKIL